MQLKTVKCPLSAPTGTVNGVIDGSGIARRAHAFIVRYARVGIAGSSLSAFADAETRGAPVADR
tara:strand:+ start:168 stop:359 length:192 start_codon:yes stop_codon:yes gene_type:complete